MSSSPVMRSGRLRRRPMPTWIPPMLATLTEDLPGERGWIYEPKLDGVRALIYVSRGSVRIYSRNRKPLNDAYPELVDALTRGVRGEAVLDGEIVAFDPGRGITSFSRLQQRMQLRDPVRARHSPVEVQLYLFDCMYFEGIDLTGLSVLERKSVLTDVVSFEDPLRLTEYKTGGAPAMLRRACARQEEGIIAKRTDSVYVSARSSEWRKIKCLRRQELVIGRWVYLIVTASGSISVSMSSTVQT